MDATALQAMDPCDCCGTYSAQLVELPNGSEPPWNVCKGCIRTDASLDELEAEWTLLGTVVIAGPGMGVI